VGSDGVADDDDVGDGVNNVGDDGNIHETVTMIIIYPDYYKLLLFAMCEMEVF